jgi:hypothetical protein
VLRGTLFRHCLDCARSLRFLNDPPTT